MIILNIYYYIYYLRYWNSTSSIYCIIELSRGTKGLTILRSDCHPSCVRGIMRNSKMSVRDKQDGERPEDKHPKCLPIGNA